jgi:hypothetical protein
VRLIDKTTAGKEDKSRRIVFNSEIDQILLEGIHAARDGQRKAIKRVHEMMPSLSVEEIDFHMQEIAADGIARWLKKGEFWTQELDQILLAGIREGKAGERKSIAKILRLHPELRTAVVWTRLGQLRRTKSGEGHRGVPFSWTDELDTLLLERYRSSGINLAVSEVQKATGFPRSAILRRGHKLGVPKRSEPSSRLWTDADLRFLVESVQHLSVTVIAKELGRSKKAIWRKVAELGLSAKCEEGYTVTEVIQKLHVWHPRLKHWIAAGWIKIGRNGRITERSLRSFFREHPEELKWDRFDSETLEWLLEFGVMGPGQPRADAG